MRCIDLMKRELFSIGIDDTVQSAALRMRASGVGFLLVCDRAGRVLGTLSERDVALRLAAEDRIASRSVVDDIMTPEVLSCRPTDDVGRAEALMIRHRESRVLVMNDDGFVQGFISLYDIARETMVEAAHHGPLQ
jgi:CBS domain-containing protein